MIHRISTITQNQNKYKTKYSTTINNNPSFAKTPAPCKLEGAIKEVAISLQDSMDTRQAGIPLLTIPLDKSLDPFKVFGDMLLTAKKTEIDPSKLDLEIIYASSNGAEGSIPLAKGTRQELFERINTSDFVDSVKRRINQLSDRYRQGGS